MLRWGATEIEAAEPLPGDERHPHPRVRSTRAITIDAAPEQVWPWIVQMGIERAGFYTHDRVERLLSFGGRYVEGKRSATRIHPELQDLEVGDLIPYGGGVMARVSEIEPPRYLVAGETFVLRPLPGDRTRLIVRYQGMGFLSAAAAGVERDAPLPGRALHVVLVRIPGAQLIARAIDFFIGDPLHHYMESGMLRGIKERAGQRARCITEVRPRPRRQTLRLELMRINADLERELEELVLDCSECGQRVHYVSGLGVTPGYWAHRDPAPHGQPAVS